MVTARKHDHSLHSVQRLTRMVTSESSKVSQIRQIYGYADMRKKLVRRFPDKMFLVTNGPYPLCYQRVSFVIVLQHSCSYRKSNGCAVL